MDSLHSHQSFQYHIASNLLDVNQVVNLLQNYGITDVNVERGPNVNEISINIQNPTNQQLLGIQEVLIPLERHIQTNFYRTLHSFRDMSRFAMPETQMSPNQMAQEQMTQGQMSPNQTTQGQMTQGQMSPNQMMQRQMTPMVGQVVPPSNVQFTVPGLNI